MRLLEAIVDANQRALAGDATAGLRPAEYQDQLPIVALTCIDPRLNPLMPEVLGVPEDQFIWLRNAGNTITSPLSSTMRSLSLACAIKGGKEILIIGHSDCQVGHVGTMWLLERFQALGIGRQMLPDNLSEFFGSFGSERQNVIKAVGFARQSPIISPGVPVHGLLVDIETGKLEWLVNGYDTLGTDAVSKLNRVIDSAVQTVQAVEGLADFKVGNIQMPETTIGQAISSAGQWVEDHLKYVKIHPQETPKLSPAKEWAKDRLKQVEINPQETPRPVATPSVGPSPPRLPLPLRARIHRRP